MYCSWLFVGNGCHVGAPQCNYQCLPHWEEGSILGDTNGGYLLLYPWVLVLRGRKSLSSWIERLLNDYRPFSGSPCPFVTQQQLLRSRSLLLPLRLQGKQSEFQIYEHCPPNTMSFDGLLNGRGNSIRERNRVLKMWHGACQLLKGCDWCLWVAFSTADPHSDYHLISINSLRHTKEWGAVARKLLRATSLREFSCYKIL